MNVVKIKGLREVLAAAKEDTEIKIAALHSGIKKGGLYIQRISQKVVPVRFGVLKNSAFTRQIKPGLVVIGYTASYAIYVHEILTNKHKPGKIAKFLEQPIKDNAPAIFKVIFDQAKTYMKSRIKRR